MHSRGRTFCFFWVAAVILIACCSLAPGGTTLGWTVAESSTCTDHAHPDCPPGAHICHVPAVVHAAVTDPVRIAAPANTVICFFECSISFGDGAVCEIDHPPQLV